MVKVKKVENKDWQRCRQIRTFFHYWWEYKVVQPKELKIGIQIDTYMPMFIAA